MWGFLCIVELCSLESIILGSSLKKGIFKKNWVLPVIISYDFKISKKQFEFEKQSASNNCILDEQINTLCKNISVIKVSLRDLITLVYNRFVDSF